MNVQKPLKQELTNEQVIDLLNTIINDIKSKYTSQNNEEGQESLATSIVKVLEKFKDIVQENPTKEVRLSIIRSLLILVELLQNKAVAEEAYATELFTTAYKELDDAAEKAAAVIDFETSLADYIDVLESVSK